MRIFSSKSIYRSDAARAEYERETGAVVTAQKPKSRLRLRARDWIILGSAVIVLCLLMLGGAYLVSNRRDSTEPRPRGCSVLGEPPQALPSF